jgi:ribosomal protein L25 (general stress protein Ctc)
MYSHGTSKDIMVAQKDFASLFKGSISESVLFNLNLDGKDEKQMAFVKDYQRHPSTGQLLHVYLYKVTGD